MTNGFSAFMARIIPYLRALRRNFRAKISGVNKSQEHHACVNQISNARWNISQNIPQPVCHIILNSNEASPQRERGLPPTETVGYFNVWRTAAPKAAAIVSMPRSFGWQPSTVPSVSPVYILSFGK